MLDPFAGSGTTLAVAKKLGRHHVGIELSENYAQHAQQRLDSVRTGDSLSGVADPRTSAPPTAAGRQRTQTAAPAKARKSKATKPKARKLFPEADDAEPS